MTNKKHINVDTYVAIVAIVMSIYHLLAANFKIFSSEQHINIHISFSILIILIGLINLSTVKNKIKSTISIVLIITTIITAIYIHLNAFNFQMAIGIQPLDKVVTGFIFLVLVLVCTKITWGWIIPIICIIALLYGYYGPYFPGVFFHSGLSFPRLITYVSTNFTGIYGMLSSVSANTIVLFTIFGGLMESFGAIQSIMNVAMSASTKIRSGGAQVAVLSSGLIGSITGSVAANITLTGAVSIPLMKKRGYPSEFAAACEASASTGGAILPPVMNAAAFIIASWTSIPYIYIVAVGVTPAILYYLGISLSVYIKALKLGDDKVKDIDIPIKNAFSKLLMFIIPIVVLVILLIKNYSPQKSLFISIIVLLVIGFIFQIRDKSQSNPIKEFFIKVMKGFETGGKTVAGIAIVMAAMGIVVEILTSTGLSSKISQFTLSVAGNNMFLLSIMVALTCLIFGMGMPSASAYILAALLGAPALVSFGVPIIVAHFFVFYFAELSALTPPVAIGCLVASGLAKADFFKTCLVSMRLAIAGFVIPFLFLYRPELLLQGSVPSYIWAVAMVIIFLFNFIISVENYFLQKLTIQERILSIMAAGFSLIPFMICDIIGIILTFIVVILHVIRFKKDNNLIKKEAVL